METCKGLRKAELVETRLRWNAQPLALAHITSGGQIRAPCVHSGDPKVRTKGWQSSGGPGLEGRSSPLCHSTLPLKLGRRDKTTPIMLSEHWFRGGWGLDGQPGSAIYEQTAEPSEPTSSWTAGRMDEMQRSSEPGPQHLLNRWWWLRSP